MELLLPRKTPAQNLAFLSIMAAVNAVMAIIATLLPLSAFFIILVLPLVSALAAVYCEDKYLLPYAVGASLVAVGATAYNLESTIFYVIPAIISGCFYGFLLKKQVPVVLLVFLSALLELGLNYAALPLIKAMYDVDVIEAGLKILGLAGKDWILIIVPTFLFGYALAEASISHLLITGIINKFSLPKIVYGLDWIPALFSLLFSFIALSLGFINLIAAYLFLAFGIYFMVFGIIPLLKHNPAWIYVVFVGLAFLSFYLFAYFYSLMPAHGGLLLISLFLISVSASSLLSSLLLKRKQNRLGKKDEIS